MSESVEHGKSDFPLDANYMTINASDRTRLLIYSGCTMGLLPLLQAHSFFGAGIITVTVALMEVADIGSTPRDKLHTTCDGGTSSSSRAHCDSGWNVP